MPVCYLVRQMCRNTVGDLPVGELCITAIRMHWSAVWSAVLWSSHTPDALKQYTKTVNRNSQHCEQKAVWSAVLWSSHTSDALKQYTKSVNRNFTTL